LDIGELWNAARKAFMAPGQSSVLWPKRTFITVLFCDQPSVVTSGPLN